MTAVWLLILVPVMFLLGREVVRVHREITASQEATRRTLERRRGDRR